MTTVVKKPIKGQHVVVDETSKFNSGGYTPDEQQSITRPNNTTVYSANDIIAGASSAIFTYASANPNNGYVVDAKLTSTDTGITGTFIVHLLNAVPATYTDNAALTLTADEIKTTYIKYFYLLVETVGTQKVAYPVDANGDPTDLRVPYYIGDNKLVAILETVDGFTPSAASTVMTLTLVTEANVPDSFPKVQ